MRKISAILPVYNEEILLPSVLENIEDLVDEIVIIDGSEKGKSTDATEDIARSCEKVFYLSGVFKSGNGAWSPGLQKNTALSKASGDVFILLSADMFFLGLPAFVDVIRSDEDHKIFFTSTIEFWQDMRYVRLYSADEDPLVVSSGILQSVAITNDVKPYYDDYGNLVISDVDPLDRLLFPDVIKYHLGWIRDFKKQVDKHIMHVKQRRWGEHGDKLLSDGEMALEQWAILHVLNYPQIPSVDFGGIIPDVLKEHTDMKYNIGYSDIISNFEDRYKISPFKHHKRGIE